MLEKHVRLCRDLQCFPELLDNNSLLLVLFFEQVGVALQSLASNFAIFYHNRLIILRLLLAVLGVSQLFLDPKNIISEFLVLMHKMLVLQLEFFELLDDFLYFRLFFIRLLYENCIIA